MSFFSKRIKLYFSDLILEPKSNMTSAMQFLLAAMLAVSCGASCRDRPMKIWVYTSDIKDAGTDAGIILDLRDSLGTEYRDAFDDPNRDDFEQGSIDTFSAKAPIYWQGAKMPKSIKVSHNNEGTDAGWHLDKIVVEDPCTGGQTEFPCNCWLDADSAGDVTTKVLSPAGPPATSAPDGGNFNSQNICYWGPCVRAGGFSSQSVYCTDGDIDFPC